MFNGDGSLAWKKFERRVRRVGTGSEETYYHYLKFAKRFIEFSGMDPDELVKALREGRVDLYELLDEFVSVLVDEGKTRQTINVYIAAIRHFLLANGIKLDREELKNRVLLPRHYSQFEDRIPTKEELKLMYHTADLTTRTLLVVLVSTGMRIGEALKVKVEDLHLDHDPPYIRLRPEYCKGKRGRIVLLTPEAVDLLKQYIRVKGLREGDLLFNLSYNSAWGRLRRVFDNVDTRTVGRRYILHPHSLRKYFRTMLAVAGVHKDFINKLMGHKDYLSENYIRENLEMVKREYAKAIPYLTIQHEERRDVVSTFVDQMLELAKRYGVTESEIVEALRRKFNFELASAEVTYDSLRESLNIIYALYPEEVREVFRELLHVQTNGAVSTSRVNDLGSSLRRPKYVIARGEGELMKYLEEGYELVRELSGNRFLMRM